ncbi:unnamed protein product [Candidatus Protochlamydia amoebophila UWE25]|uniref:Uncharacterized protein n=1 Tax=Protochlamydia amoebophila (strain UWE25) TaxID=264201 RepID=A0A2P9H9N1_PARUW|nr:unnamed protein product [Candidatus Protochlamydia amoebophila UWE25]
MPINCAPLFIQINSAKFCDFLFNFFYLKQLELARLNQQAVCVNKAMTAVLLNHNNSISSENSKVHCLHFKLDKFNLLPTFFFIKKEF